MKVWSALFNFIAVLVLAMMILTVYKIDAVNKRQFEEIRLSYAINYATEAAFRATIETDSIATDYSKGELNEVQVNPAMALPVFYNILALSYDMSLSEDIKMKMEQSIATGFLCATNGYYILEPIEWDSNPYDHEIGGEYKLSFGVKRPYIVYAPDSTMGIDRLFAVNIVNEKSIEYIPELFADADMVKDEPLIERSEYKGTPLTKELVRQSVSKWLTEDINMAIHKRNLMSIYDTVNTFYFPAGESMTAINNVTSPSLAIIFQDSTFLNGYDMDVVSVGGVRVQPRSNVLGFKLKGDPTLYYCYAGQQLGDTFKNGDKKPNTEPDFSITARYNTVHEAVLDGCSPHLMYLQEPFGKEFE